MRQYKKNIGVLLDEPVKRALSVAAQRADSIAALARKMGLPVGRVSLWLAPNPARPVKCIPMDTWAIVYPHIREHLPPGDARYHPGAAPAAARCQSCEEGEARDTPPAFTVVQPPPPQPFAPKDELSDLIDLMRVLPRESQDLLRSVATAEAVRLFLKNRKAAL
jgi:hypothetical protein